MISPLFPDGPWVGHIAKNGGVWDYQVRTLEPHNPAGGPGKHIASVNQSVCVGANGEALMDFIAAAPMMIDALELAVVVLERMIRYLDAAPDAIAARDAAVEAIALSNGSKSITMRG